MGAAKGVGREDGTVERGAGEGLQRDGVAEAWTAAADGAGDSASSQCCEREGEFHQPAAAERVAKAAFPTGEGSAGKLAGDGFRCDLVSLLVHLKMHSP